MELTSKKSELKKHIGTVDISNSLSLVQRKAFSVLVHNAYHDLKEADGEIREIPLKAFCELLGFDSKNITYLDEHIKKLQTTLIEWRYNPEEFDRVTFFSYTGIEDGMFRYRFAPELEEKIYNPEIYARINILTVSQFESRYALALYENLARYRPNPSKGFPGGSPKWKLDEFREIMGVSDIASYKVFRDLSKRVLQPSIDEINRVSDLLVKVEKIKQGRSIVALKFHINDNPQQNLGFIPEPATIATEAENPLAKEMNELYGVPILTGGEWLLQYGEDRFKQVLDLVGESVEQGSVKRPIGYITKAFKEGWTEGSTVKEAQEKLKKKKAAQKKEATQKKKALLEAKKEEKKSLEEKEKNGLLGRLENLSDDGRVKLFEKFYDDSVGSWMGRFPLDKGQDPRNCDNYQVQKWFIDFLKEEEKSS